MRRMILDRKRSRKVSRAPTRKTAPGARFSSELEPGRARLAIAAWRVHYSTCTIMHEAWRARTDSETQAMGAAGSGSAKRKCIGDGVPRGDRARGAAPARQARHDAAPIGAGFAEVRTLSRADRERRRQPVGQRAARDRA